MEHLSVGNTSAVSWRAILVGALCAAALSFVLLILGFGLGLSAVSPWSNSGASAAAIGISSILWITFTQIASSGLGGYLAGRLRSKWTELDVNEAHFRDTAHGLTTWALSTLLAVVVLTSSISSILGAGVKAGASVVGGGAQAVSSMVDTDKLSELGTSYLTDSLLRANPSATDVERASDEVRKELSTLIVRNLSDGDLSEADIQYAAKLVAKYTGLTEAEAQVRIQSTLGKAKQMAATAKTSALEAVEAARKSAAYSALWMFAALMCGAFFASLMATFGGRQRDLYA